MNTLYNKSLNWEQNKIILHSKLMQKLARARNEYKKDLISLALDCLEQQQGEQNVWAFSCQLVVREILG